MTDPVSMLHDAHDQLNQAHEIYASSPTDLAKEFDQLKLQACIFQYEVCAEMHSFITTDPSGFARKIALKGLIHQLYEYESVNGDFVKRVKALALKRGFEISDSALRSERRKRRSEFQHLRDWVTIRNKATGHYDKNTEAQINLLETIDPDQVMGVCDAFFSCNMEFLKMLREVGRRNCSQP